MTWTRERPTRPGWYWFRGDGLPFPLRIFETKNGALMAAFAYGDRWVASVDGEWYGPLEVPE